MNICIRDMPVLSLTEAFCADLGLMVLAASFFALSVLIVVFGYIRGYKSTEVYLPLLASLMISLSALDLPCIEKRLPTRAVFRCGQSAASRRRWR